MKYLDSLTTLGLTKDQAKIYEILLSAPLLPVRLISSKSGVSRELTYVVLGQLEQIGLVERSNQGKVILFRAEHPRMIKKILEEKQQTFLEAEKAYQDIIGTMISDFNVIHNKPFIRFYEGIEGLQKTYGHILRHAKTVYVIRSLYDYDNPELRSMITDQLEKQAAKNILAQVRSKQPAEFRYFDFGSMATIGRSAAVFDAFNIRLTGFLAWLGWLFVHILYLIGFRNRLVVLLDWAWAYWTFARYARVVTGVKTSDQ